MKHLTGHTIVHQHDSDEYCWEHARDYPMAPRCRYHLSTWSRIKMWFFRH